MTTVTVDETFPDVRSPVWGPPDWPSWLTSFRPHQQQAIMEVLDLFLSGHDVVMLSAPTGAGKTCIAEAVRRLMNIEKSLYVATTKQLQDQAARDFDYAKVLKGRANYRPIDVEASDFMPITCADCVIEWKRLPACRSCTHETAAQVPHCNWCHPFLLCPYQIAKNEALNAPLAITNTAYFVSEANGPGMLSKRGLVILDEADALENILVDFCEVHISERRRKQFNIEPPTLKTVEEAWLPWVEEEAVPKIKAALELIDNPPQRLEDVREYTFLTRLLNKLATLAKLLEEGNAVYDGYQRGDITFQPIRVNHDARTLLWQHSQRWLLMSATLIPEDLEQALGIEEAGLKWGVVNVPSTFPVANRPIIVRNVANMVHREKETAWPLMVEAVKRVLAKHPGERTLVHTVSYELTQYLFDKLRACGRPIILYSSAKERMKALEIYSNTPGAVLLAPSMDRGIDLVDDLCRVVIIVKVPWMNVSDKRVQKRTYGPGGRLWYSIQAIRAIVQMTGRGVRSEDDRATSYILDSQFRDNLWKKGKHLFPDWWSEALDWTGGGI